MTDNFKEPYSLKPVPSITAAYSMGKIELTEEYKLLNERINRAIYKSGFGTDWDTREYFSETGDIKLMYCYPRRYVTINISLADMEFPPTLDEIEDIAKAWAESVKLTEHVANMLRDDADHGSICDHIEMAFIEGYYRATEAMKHQQATPLPPS